MTFEKKQTHKDVSSKSAFFFLKGIKSIVSYDNIVNKSEALCISVIEL